MQTEPGGELPGKSRLARVVDITGLSVGVAIFLIGIFVAYGVLARTFFAMTTSWVTETAEYLMAYITFFGAAYALKEGAHVAVDMVVDKTTGVCRRVLVTMADCFMLAVIALLTWVSYWFFADAWNSNEVSNTILSVRMWIPYLSFVVGMAWLFVVQLVRAAGHQRACSRQKGEA